MMRSFGFALLVFTSVSLALTIVVKTPEGAGILLPPCSIKNAHDEIRKVWISASGSTLNVRFSCFKPPSPFTTRDGVVTQCLYYDGSTWTRVYHRNYAAGSFPISKEHVTTFSYTPASVQGLHTLRCMIIDKSSSDDDLTPAMTCASGTTGTGRPTSARHYDNADVQYNVITDCPKEGPWPSTPSGKTASVKCDGDCTGLMTRPCKSGSWGSIDRSRCAPKCSHFKSAAACLKHNHVCTWDLGDPKVPIKAGCRLACGQWSQSGKAVCEDMGSNAVLTGAITTGCIYRPGKTKLDKPLCVNPCPALGHPGKPHCDAWGNRYIMVETGSKNPLACRKYYQCDMTQYPQALKMKGLPPTGRYAAGPQITPLGTRWNVDFCWLAHGSTVNPNTCGSVSGAKFSVNAVIPTCTKKFSMEVAVVAGLLLGSCVFMVAWFRLRQKNEKVVDSYGEVPANSRMSSLTMSRAESLRRRESSMKELIPGDMEQGKSFAAVPITPDVPAKSPSMMNGKLVFKETDEIVTTGDRVGTPM